MIETAKEFESLGLFPVPCNVHKESCEVWAKWESEPKDVDGWADLFKRQNGIGIKLGSASGNLIVIDIDQKHDSTGSISNRFLEAIKYLLPESWDSFYIEETRSGGLHVFLRVKDYSTEKYIPAYTMDFGKSGELQRFPLIEVLCEGQMVFTHPTPNYRIAQGSIEEIPTISKDEWNELLGICRSFNEVPEREAELDDTMDHFDDLDPNDQRPGTIFNRRVEPSMVVKFMTQHGWKVHKKIGDVYFLTRPGKDSGVSATFNFDGRKLLCVFSSSTEFETHRGDKLRGHNPFSIVAQLKYNGDYKATTAYLVERGYVNPDEWDEVEPLEPVKAKPFLLDDVLPPSCSGFKKYILEVSESFQVHPEMVLMPAVSIASLAVCSAAKVRINEDWTEDAPVWTIVIADASERKSPVLKELMTPLNDWLERFKYDNKGAIRSRERMARGLAKKIEKMEGDLEKAIAKGAEVSHLDASLTLAEHDLEEMGDIFEMPNLIQSDVTPEALVSVLAENGGTVGVISAEAEPIEVALGLYSDKPNFAVYLKGFSCETYTSTRKGSGQITVEEPRVVLSVMMQSEPMEKLADSRVARERGFIGRCFFATPQSKVGARDLSPPTISRDAKLEWKRCIDKIMDFPHKNRLIENGEGGIMLNKKDPVEIQISKDALDLFMEARAINEKHLVAGGELDESTGWGGKLMGNVCRLALTLHFIGGGSIHGEISLETMKAAIAWVEPLTEHYYAATGHIGESQADKVVHKTMKKIIDKGLNVDDSRVVDIAEALKTTKRNTSKKWMPVFDRMQELGFIRMFEGEKPKSGPAPRLMKFHPNFVNLAK